MERVDTDPDAYLDTVPAVWADTMSTLDELIRQALPDRTRCLWVGTFWGGTEQTIIGYGDIVQPRPRGDDVEWFAVGLACQSKHVSLYVNAVEDGQYLTKAWADRLGKVKVGSASIAIRRLDDVDLDALRSFLDRANQLTGPDASPDA